MLNATQARKQFLAVHAAAIAKAQVEYPGIFKIIEERLEQAITNGFNYFLIEENELDNLTFKGHLMYHLAYTLDFDCERGQKDGIKSYRFSFDNRPEREGSDKPDIRVLHAPEGMQDLPEELQEQLINYIMRDAN